MIVFPNCKINLGLNITKKRSDGYHNLETIFLPIHIQDILEIIPSQINKTTLTQSGLIIDGATENNICIKAYHLLKKDFPNLLPIQIHLHKIIPMGAGLGGGSANGTYTLQLLNQIFNLQLTEQDVLNYALHLGSDCPFFIHNKPCYATGRGEKLQEIDLNLKDYKIYIINPGIHISTQWAFANITPNIPSTNLLSIIQQPIETWRDNLINDFEAPTIKGFPLIGAIKQELYYQGAIYASMTGSGSTLYGIFNKTNHPKFNIPNHCSVFEIDT